MESNDELVARPTPPTVHSPPSLLSQQRKRQRAHHVFLQELHSRKGELDRVIESFDSRYFGEAAFSAARAQMCYCCVVERRQHATRKQSLAARLTAAALLL